MREREKTESLQGFFSLTECLQACVSAFCSTCSVQCPLYVSYLSQAIWQQPLQPAGRKTSFLPFINIPSLSLCHCLSRCLSSPLCLSLLPSVLALTLLQALLVVRCMCGIQSHANLWQNWAGQQSRRVAVDSGNAKQCGTSWGTDHYIYRDGWLDLHCTLSISHFSAAPLDTEYSIMDLSCSAVS